MFEFRASFRLAVAGCALAFAGPAFASDPTFEKDVLPILTANCLSCHGGFHRRAELDLRSVAAIERGGKSGSAAVAGDSAKSLLWQKIADDEMPKGPAKLSKDDKEILRKWIDARMPTAPGYGKQLAEPDAKRDPKVVAAEVDRLVEQRLQAAKVAPSPLADDAEFLRRVTLDVTGRLPTAEQARSFLESTDSERRSKLVNTLLASPEFGKHWGMVWHHWIVPPSDDGKRTYDVGLANWLAKSLNEGSGWNDVVHELLTATGGRAAKPQVGFMAANPDPQKAADKARSIFLGVNMECAECHNHPYAQWRQKEDYWGMAAFFSRTKVAGSKGAAVVTEVVVPKAPPPKLPPPKAPAGKPKEIAPAASIKIPPSSLLNVGAVVPASLLGESPGQLEQPPFRPVFADWVVAPRNPYFARATVNRWWWCFFGRGFVMPLDGFQDENPPSHPELLDALAGEFRNSGYDVKHLVRCICNSRTYQRTSQTTSPRDVEAMLFARMSPRLLSPDVLYDALTQSLGVKDLNLTETIAKKGDKPPPPRTLFVNSFNHGAEPPNAVEYHHEVLQILKLLNSQDVNDGGTTAKRLAALSDSDRAIEELYLTVFSRRPSADERRTVGQFVSRQSDPTTGYRMLVWALLNSAEFAFNH